MNPTQIAAEAWNDIRNNVVVCSCSPEQYEQAVAIIKAAIEKATERITDLSPKVVRVVPMRTKPSTQP